jgi:hypothetical protein
LRRLWISEEKNSSERNNCETLPALGKSITDRVSVMKLRVLSLLFAAVAIIAIPEVQAQLTCSAAPCVTSNSEVSSPASNITAAGMMLAASPVTFSQNLTITTNYFVDMSYCYGALGDSSSSGVFLSTDSGSVWSGGCLQPSSTDLGPQYDPIAAYDNNGNLFSGQLGSSGDGETVFLQKLPAGSTVWGDFFPTLSYTDQTTETFFDFDFPGIAIDNNLADPCIYVTAWELGLSMSEDPGPVSAVVVGHSCDGGSSWTTQRVSSIISAPKFAAYPRVTVSQGHDVTATWVQFGNGKGAEIYESSSTDSGNTWSTPTRALSLSMTPLSNCINIPQVSRALPNTCVRMFYFPQLASTYISSTGAMHTVAVFPSDNGANVAINYAESSLGSAWSKPIILSSVSADQFEPCVATNPANTAAIGVAWLDTRNSPEDQPDTLYDAYGMTSADAGSTWSPVYRLSSESGRTQVETEPQSQYLGDWTGCAWQNNIFYYAFPSTANGANQVATIVGLNP